MNIVQNSFSPCFLCNVEVKSGKLSGYKMGRAYTFDVLALKKF